MPQAVLVAADNGADPELAIAVAATYVLGFRATQGRVRLVEDWQPRRKSAAGRVWWASEHELPALVSELVAFARDPPGRPRGQVHAGLPRRGGCRPRRVPAVPGRGCAPAGLVEGSAVPRRPDRRRAAPMIPPVREAGGDRYGRVARRCPDGPPETRPRRGRMGRLRTSFRVAARPPGPSRSHPVPGPVRLPRWPDRHHGDGVRSPRRLRHLQRRDAGAGATTCPHRPDRGSFARRAGAGLPIGKPPVHPNGRARHAAAGFRVLAGYSSTSRRAW